MSHYAGKAVNHLAQLSSEWNMFIITKTFHNNPMSRLCSLLARFQAHVGCCEVLGFTFVSCFFCVCVVCSRHHQHQKHLGLERHVDIINVIDYMRLLTGQVNKKKNHINIIKRIAKLIIKSFGTALKAFAQIFVFHKFSLSMHSSPAHGFVKPHANVWKWALQHMYKLCVCVTVVFFYSTLNL